MDEARPTYNPQDEATPPKRNMTWERQTNSSELYKIPKRSTSSTTMVSSTPARTPRFRSTSYEDTAKRLKHRCAPTDLPKFRHRDPRRKPADQKSPHDDAKRKEDFKYYHWLKTVAIPNSTKNLQYFIRMVKTVTHDISTNDDQMKAIHAMSDDPYQSDTLHGMAKMRKKMVAKLQEFQTKLNQHKIDAAGLHKLLAEQESLLDIPKQGQVQKNYIKLNGQNMTTPH